MEKIPTKVLLASSSLIFLEGIHKIFEGEENIEVVMEATNLHEIENNAHKFKPEIVFIDNRVLCLNIPKLHKSITLKSPHTKIILLSDRDENAPDLPNVVHISKHTNYKDLIKLIKGENIAEGAGQTRMPDVKHKLTGRELEIIKLIAGGLNNKKIASKLSISEKTVKAHLTNIFTKLDIKNRYELILYAKKLENK